MSKTIKDLKPALALALEALERLHYEMYTMQGEQAITAIREALAEQPAPVTEPYKQQEPKQSEIFCGVDFADGLLSVCVFRRRDDDVAELLHAEQIELPAPATELREQQSAERVEPVSGVVIREGLPALLQDRNIKPTDQRLYTSPQPAPVAEPHEQHDCSRSHPHENMDAMCELRTEIARLTNENARLKAKQQSDEVNAYRMTLLCIRDGLQQGMSKSIQKLQAREINDVLGMPSFASYRTSPSASPSQGDIKPWVGLNDDDLDGYTKSNVLMVRHFERVLFERNTQPCLEGLPEPIRTPPEKGTEYWTIGLGRWTWGGTTHDYSSLGNGIWRCETDVWEVHAAIRRALGIESNIAAVFQNRREAKLRERNEHREKNA